SDLAGADGAAVWRELQDARARGVVGKLGVSSYDPARLLELVERFELELVQVPFNLLDRRFFSPELCAAYGRRKVEVHARSVFLQGLFFLKAETLPENLEFARPTVERLQELGLNLPAASLALALGNERISKVVVGVTSSAELAEILSWPVAPLQPELDAELAGLWKLTSGRVLDPSLWR
ncbi:MAG: aldo/keto reductase, partial [Deltaproteobacteria bacterium]|nr:aldo/keto reductase [Deltaproteobacteria bacterium]